MEIEEQGEDWTKENVKQVIGEEKENVELRLEKGKCRKGSEKWRARRLAYIWP